MNPKRSKSRVDRKMSMVHPNAAAIDVGATMHMAAVGADQAPESDAALEPSRPISISWLTGLRNAASRPSSWN